MTNRPPFALLRRPLLALREVGKTYSNGIAALQGISLRMSEEPEFIAVLGPSGCGKSTLLRIIAGLDEPTTGAVVRTADDCKAGIGFVFQEATLMPWATVFDNVYLPLRLKGKSRAAAAPAVRDLLNRVGLIGFADAYPRQLSGGMKMRVSTARALVTGPRILLMDEPFAALDEITRMQIERDLLDLWQVLRFTAVFVTHSVFEAAFLANRVIVMTPRPGRIAAEFAVGAPYPRTEAFRTSPGYAETCRRIFGALAVTMGGAK